MGRGVVLVLEPGSPGYGVWKTKNRHGRASGALGRVTQVPCLLVWKRYVLPTQ